MKVAQEESNLNSLKSNLGQYTGATLEGGSARLDKFARYMCLTLKFPDFSSFSFFETNFGIFLKNHFRLLGGKKKESKGLFGRKPANSVGFQRPVHTNVENGNDLNRELENQFYRAKNYHSKHVRGFQQ